MLYKYRNLQFRDIVVGDLVFKARRDPNDYNDGIKIIAKNRLTPENLKALKQAQEQGLIEAIKEDSINGIADNNSNKVLIVRGGGIGDCLMTTPLVRVIRKKYPQHKLFYETSFPEIFQFNPHIDCVIKSGKRPLYGKFDCIYDLNGIVETFKMGGGTLTMEESKTINRMELFFKKLKLSLPEDMRTEYFIQDKEKEWAREFLSKEKGISKDDILVGYHVNCTSNYRIYPLVLAKEMVNGFAKKGIKVILLGKNLGWNSKDLNYFNNHFYRCVDCLDLELRATAAIIDRCDLFIGPDSGLLHLANALNIPNIALFGNINPYLRLKYYRKCQVLYPENKLICIPCNDLHAQCPPNNHMIREHMVGAECMWQINPQDIVDSALRMLGNKETKPKNWLPRSQIRGLNIYYKISDIDITEERYLEEYGYKKLRFSPVDLNGGLNKCIKTFKRKIKDEVSSMLHSA